jgi:hypothetical protein
VQAQTTQAATSLADNYVTEHGFPTAEMAERAYDDADLNRAIQAYRFFYPTVSGRGWPTWGFWDLTPATAGGISCCRRTGAARCRSATTCGARLASASSEASARCRSEAMSSRPPNACRRSRSTRSIREQIGVQTEQRKAVLSSLFGIGENGSDKPVDLFFGPSPPSGHEDHWIQTIPDRDGSSTCVSTAPISPPSTAAGGPATST